MANRWVPSRFTRSVHIADKGRMLYNAYTGAIAAVPPHEEADVRDLLDHECSSSAERNQLFAELRDAGFIVPAGTDELRLADRLHEALRVSRSRHLVIMPTEACNYRCTYCYQSFDHGAMDRRTIEGLKAYVRQVVRQIDHLSISWFGESRCLHIRRSSNYPIHLWSVWRMQVSVIRPTCPPMAIS